MFTNKGRPLCVKFVWTKKKRLAQETRVRQQFKITECDEGKALCKSSWAVYHFYDCQTEAKVYSEAAMRVKYVNIHILALVWSQHFWNTTPLQKVAIKITLKEILTIGAGKIALERKKYETFIFPGSHYAFSLSLNIVLFA